ncbi:MAG: ABC transporter permease subunit [Microthrixaceae bacterium]
MSVQPSTDARIVDRGYRRYDGDRLGVAGAVSSVTRYTIQRVFGIHRKFRFKVLPILSIAIAYIPHVVWVGIVVLTRQLDEQMAGGDGGFGAPPGTGRRVANLLIKDYPSSYGNVVAAIALFAAFVAPEVLCPDRRTGMLGLYFASPLNRWTYLRAKLVAVVSMLMLVTLGPPLLLLIGYSTQGYGPSGPAEWASTFGRVLLTGVGIAVFHTAVSLAISSVTSRRAAASAAFVVVVMGTGVLIPALIYEGGLSMDWGAFNLLTLPLEFAYRVFGQPSSLVDPRTFYDTMSTPVVYGAFAGWIVLSAVVVWDRYRRIEVTR